jgi:hypothetical protein
MKLRTISAWVIYDPRHRDVLATRATKKEIMRCHVSAGCVIVNLRGHYLPPRKDKP